MTQLLLGLATAILALSATGVWTELQNEWRPHQEAYRRLTEELAMPEGSEPLRTGIQQIMLPAVDVYDRCTTCHVGIGDPAAAGAPQPIAAHPGALLDAHPPVRFGCTLCHGGQGLGTTWRGAAHEPIPYFHDPILPRVLLEARCGWCHEGRDVPGASLLRRGRRLLAERGCYGCHEIPGYEHELPAGPDLDGISQKLNPAWLDAWLRDPPGTLAGARMPTFELTDDERGALRAFLMTGARSPTLEPVPESLTGDADWGRTLFGVSRCTTCHSLDGRGGTIGPDLGGVGAKVTFAWLYGFLRDPHTFHPTTPMLRYEFSPKEALDLATFLSEEMIGDEFLPGADPIDATPQLVDRGERLFSEIGCAGCHPKSGVKMHRIGPSLVGYGDRLPNKLMLGGGLPRNLADWTLAKLRAPAEVGDRSRMPDPHLSEPDAGALTVALLSLSRRVTDRDYRIAAPQPVPFEPQGRVGVLWRRYRCSVCHEVDGYGGSLAHVPLDREGSEVRREWLRQYLLQPYPIRVNQVERMPRLRMSEADAELLSSYIDMVLRDDDIPAEVPGGPFTELERSQGEVLYRRLGCASCHELSSKGGYVGPPLDGVARRLEPGWVYSFLSDPTRWRPATRQPDYELSDADARSITAYLMSLLPEDDTFDEEASP